MISINIICVGKLKEKYFKDAVAEYSKRLSRFCNLSVTEIPDEKIPDGASDAICRKILEKEGANILKAVKDTPMIALCVEGKLISSEDLSQTLELSSMNSGKLAFVIGGSLGLCDEVKKQAISKISFGRITLPHQLMRVVLLEQIFRGFKISNNETYHK